MGILSDIGDAFTGGLVSAYGASKQRKHARKEAKKMRDFQERMSNTQVQRRMADLKAAGINPILAAAGQGASSPGGAMAPVNDPVGAGVNTAMARLRQKADLRQIDQATKNLTEQEKKIAWEKANLREQNSILWHNARIARNEADLSDTTKLLDKSLYSGTKGKLLRSAQLMSSPVNSAASAIRVLK